MPNVHADRQVGPLRRPGMAVLVGALALAVLPAAAAPPVEPRSIAALPQTDGVALEGYAAGVPVIVDVVRAGIVVGRSRPISPAPDGTTTLATINSAVDPGGCWDDTTPDIIPGDVVRATQGGVIEDTAVNDIVITGPVMDDGGNAVTVSGTARTVAGQALAIGGLEVRLLSPNFAARPFLRVLGAGAGSDPGATLVATGSEWTARFGNLDLNPGDHTAALAAQAVAEWSSAGTDVTEVTFNPGATGGPQGACTAPAATEGITLTNPPVFRFDSTALTINGIATGDAATVSVAISDANPGTADVVTSPVNVVTSGAGKAWTVTVPGSLVLSLTDGALTLTPTFNPGQVGQRIGAAKVITKNMVIPDTTAPIASIIMGPKPFNRSTAATFEMTANESSRFQCRLDAAALTPCASPTTLINLAQGSHTFTVRAIDAAGNTSPDVSLTWQVDTTKPRVRSTVPLPLRRFFARTGRLAVGTTCNERCTATIVTRVIMPGVTPRQVRSTRTRAVNAGRTGQTRVTLTARQLTALRRSLGANEVVQVAITTTAVDRAGNRSTTRTRVDVTAALLR